MYGSVSLCEHPGAAGVVETLAVVISCIFSLNSTDGQSEITSRSTTSKSRWSARLALVRKYNQEFRRLSRYLMVPVQIVAIIVVVVDSTAGFTVQSDSLSRSSR